MGVAQTVYQALIPESARLRIWDARRGLRKTGHELRWWMMSESQRKAWTNARLQDKHSFWIFLLGCNNSGTTLLSTLLGGHPSIRNLPKEGQRLTKAIPNSAELKVGRTFTARMDLLRWTEDDDASMVPRLRYDWAALYEPGPGVLLEKSPPNSLRSRWLQANFRPSKFLTIVRHPYAVCEGIRRRRNKSIEEASTHWKTVHEILAEDESLLDSHWLITYEEMCRAPYETLKQLERHFNLPDWFDESYTEQVLPVHNCNNAASSVSNFNDKSFARLSPEDVEIINDIAHEQMVRLGYEPSDPAEFGDAGRWSQVAAK